MALRRLKNNLIFAVLAGIFFAMQALPLRLARAVGAALGRLFFLLVPYERKKAMRMVSTAFPEKDETWVRSIASQSLGNLGRCGAEFMRMERLDPARLDEWVGSVEGFEHFTGAMQGGRGLVAVTAHLGHWELLAAWVAARVPVGVVARQVYDPRLDAKLNAIRQRLGVTVFPRNTSLKPVLKWLKDGKCLGVLADQDTNIDSMFVPVFGKLAKTPSGPAWLAQKTGAALATGFCGRGDDGKFHLRFGPPIAVPGRREAPESLRQVVTAYTQRTEDAIRRWPNQYAWIHDRWRTRPPEEQSHAG